MFREFIWPLLFSPSFFYFTAHVMLCYADPVFLFSPFYLSLSLFWCYLLFPFYFPVTFVFISCSSVCVLSVVSSCLRSHWVFSLLPSPYRVLSLFIFLEFFFQPWDFYILFARMYCLVGCVLGFANWDLGIVRRLSFFAPYFCTLFCIITYCWE